MNKASAMQSLMIADDRAAVDDNGMMIVIFTHWNHALHSEYLRVWEIGLGRSVF